MTKRRVGGYIYRAEVQRALIANRAAREALRRMVEEQPSPRMLAILIARAVIALGENLAALREIEQIKEKDEGA